MTGVLIKGKFEDRYTYKAKNKDQGEVSISQGTRKAASQPQTVEGGVDQILSRSPQKRSSPALDF